MQKYQRQSVDARLPPIELHSSSGIQLWHPGSTKALGLIVSLCAAGAGGFGLLLGMASRRGLSGQPSRVVGYRQRPVDPIAAIGRPFVKDGLPIWNVDNAELHGAAPDELGMGMMYYSLAYMQKPRNCVVIGEGAGFVPILLRRGQIAGGMVSGKTYVIDRDYDLEFHTAFPEIEIIKGPSLPNGFLQLEEKIHSSSDYHFIDYLHLDGDHTYRGARQDLEAFSDLLADNGIVTIHNTDIHSDGSKFGVSSMIAELKQDPCWEVVDFTSILPHPISTPDQFGSGTAVLKRRCPRDMHKDFHWAPLLQAPAHVQQEACSDEKMLVPRCNSCIPGTRSTLQECSPDVSAQAMSVRRAAAEDALAADEGAAAAYTGTPERHQLRAYVLAWLLKTRPRRVLDLGTYLDPLESFSNFTYGGWCPELVVSVDPLLTPVAKRFHCGRLGAEAQVTVVHLPLAIEEALLEDSLRNIAYDAVLCLGCHEVRSKKVMGFEYDVLESFKRPYELFIEFSLGDELSKFPKSSSGRIISQRHAEQAPESDDVDVMRVIRYSEII